MNIRVIVATIKKDLKVFFSDRRSVMISFLTPIALASFFGLIFSGGGGTSKIKVLVVDLDHSVVSSAVVNGLKGDSGLDVVEDTEVSARERVRNGKEKIRIAIVIPEHFGYQSTRSFFNSSEKPEIKFLYDPSSKVTLEMIRGIVTQHVMEIVSKEAFSGQTGRDAVDETLKKLESDTSSSMPEEDKKILTDLMGSVRKWQDKNLEQKKTMSGQEKASSGGPAGGLSLPFTARSVPVTSGKKIKWNPYAHYFTGMGIQFLLFAAIDLGMAILEERDKSLWKRFRAAPVSRGSLLMGKTAGGAVIAFLILAVTMAFGMVVFGFGVKGSWAGFILICIMSALMAASLGMLVAALGKTTGATRGIAILVVLIMVMLGGAWMPSFLFPEWMQQVIQIVPVTWSISGLDAVLWRGTGFIGSLEYVAVLAGFTLLFSMLAVWRFKWEGE